MIPIRQLDPDDLNDYRLIRHTALRLSPQAFSSTIEREAERTEAEDRERLAASLVFAAYAAGRPVGMAGLRRESGPKERHKAAVWGFFVDPSFHRRGIGRALLAALLEAAPAGVEQLTLSVLASNQAAIALYESHGFVRWGLEPRAFREGDRHVDSLHMIHMLDPAGCRSP